jgi:preprotein translocase subunit SecA
VLSTTPTAPANLGVAGRGSLPPGAATQAEIPGGAASPGGSGGTNAITGQIVKGEHEKLGRNEPCWCGSGKKFKLCHGR